MQSRCEMRGTVLTCVRMQTNVQCTITAATGTEFSKCKVYTSANQTMSCSPETTVKKSATQIEVLIMLQKLCTRVLEGLERG